jgi:D-amino-acid dehydrogenase
MSHSSARQWRRGMAAYVPLNERSLEAFDVLAAGGVTATTTEASPFLACYGGERDIRGLLAELEQIRGEIIEGGDVTHLQPAPAGVDVVCRSGEKRQHDAVVAATGAVFGELTARFGVRQPVQAGRGYSFSVPVERMPGGPLYFPKQRVACTPLGGRLRVAGMMEFRRPADALDPRRITAVVDAVRPFLTGVNLDDRRDEWVGSRPCNPDGLPLTGATAAPRVFVRGWPRDVGHRRPCGRYARGCHGHVLPRGGCWS